MTKEIDLRRAAREIFDVALASVDAGDAVRSAMRLVGSRLTIQETTIDFEKAPQAIYALAIGKAAFPMAVALDGLLGDRIKTGFIVGTYIHEFGGKLFSPAKNFASPWRQCEAAHPLPAKSSLMAAQSAFELLRRADDERALVIFLISGGGSSMIEWPRDEQITLDNLRMANRALVSCGANISEINAVRRAFSAVKGGRLAACAPNADQITLIISDTAKGQDSIVASGPTCDPPLDAPDAVEVIERYGLVELLPPSILRVVNLPTETPVKSANNRLRRHYVLLDCETAIRAATDEARRMGFAAEYTNDISEQPIVEGCRLMLSRLIELRSRESTGNRSACLISGGEFSCPVRGDGVGGRNAETVLRCAIDMDETRQRQTTNMNALRLSVLSAGTDGIDGNSSAAGAIATDETVERARMTGLNPVDFLERSDAFSFFNVLDDAIITGPTGTNVRDLRITLAS